MKFSFNHIEHNFIYILIYYYYLTVLQNFLSLNLEGIATYRSHRRLLSNICECFRWTFVLQEVPFACDLSNAAQDLTTFEEANASCAKTSRVQCQSAADAGLFARALAGGWALAAVWANSYAIVNNVAHISKLTATPHPGVAVVVSYGSPTASPPFYLHLSPCLRCILFAFPLTIFNIISLPSSVTYHSNICTTSANGIYGRSD